MGLKSCDGNQELLNFLRSDLIEVATRLQKGGLGYMEGTSEFEARVRVQENPLGKLPLSETQPRVISRAVSYPAKKIKFWFRSVLHNTCGTKRSCMQCFLCHLFCLLSIRKWAKSSSFLLLTLGSFSFWLDFFFFLFFPLHGPYT